MMASYDDKRGYVLYCIVLKKLTTSCHVTNYMSHEVGARERYCGQGTEWLQIYNTSMFRFKVFRMRN